MTRNASNRRRIAVPKWSPMLCFDILDSCLPNLGSYGNFLTDTVTRTRTDQGRPRCFQDYKNIKHRARD